MAKMGDMDNRVNDNVDFAVEAGVAQTPRHYKHIMDDMHASSVGSAIVIDAVKNQDIMVFLGNTRAGKSTLVNYINGNRLTAAWDPDSFKTIVVKALDDPDNRFGPAIGIGPVAETTIPTRWESALLREAIWDAPGFDDNRSIVQDISNAFYIKHLLDHARSVKFVLVSDFNDIYSGNIQQFTNLIKTVHRILPNIAELIQSISIIFNKVENGFDGQKICHLLQRKILDHPGINMAQEEKLLLHYFIDNPRSIGIFNRVVDEGDLLPLTDDSSVVQAINQAVGSAMLHDIIPGISQGSEIFLLKNYKAVCESEDFDIILQNVKDLYCARLQSIIDTLMQDNIPEVTIIQVREQVHGVSIILEELSDRLERGGVGSVVQRLNDLDPVIAQEIARTDIFTKVEFVKFVDKLLKIDQSQIFGLKLLKVIAEIEQKIGNANVKIELKLERISQVQADEQDIALEAAYDKRAAELEEAVRALDIANAKIAASTFHWYDQAFAFGAGVLPNIGDIVDGIIHINEHGHAPLIRSLGVAIQSGVASMAHARGEADAKRAAAEEELATAQARVASLRDLSEEKDVPLNYCISQEYDNEILNHPELLRAFSLVYGSKATSRLLDLSAELGMESMQEICSNPNAIDILGACIGIES